MQCMAIVLRGRYRFCEGMCSWRRITPPSFNIMAEAASILYDWLYTTSLTPVWTILTEHRRQGHLCCVSLG